MGIRWFLLGEIDPEATPEKNLYEFALTKEAMEKPLENPPEIR